LEKFQPFSPLHTTAIVAGAMALLMLPWRFVGTK